MSRLKYVTIATGVGLSKQLKYVVTAGDHKECQSLYPQKERAFFVCAWIGMLLRSTEA